MASDNKTYIDFVTNELKETINFQISAGFEKSLSEYLDMGIEHLKRRYKFENNQTRYMVWETEYVKEVTRIWTEIEHEVSSNVEKLLQKAKTRKMMKEVRVTTAKAAIAVAMKEAGIDHIFEGQTYRAKVSVAISKNRALTFYIPYKNINDKLPTIINSLKSILHNLTTLGSNISISRYFGEGF